MQSLIRALARFFVAPLVSAALVVTPASAITLLDTINGVPFVPSVGWTIDGGGVAIQFSTATAATITDITAYIWGWGVNPSVTLGIMADSSGPSGTFLNSQTVATNMSLPVVFNSLSWTIGPGDYWLAALGTGSAWEYNSTLPVQNMSFFSTPSWGVAFPDYPALALITADTAAVPVPAALPLFASALGALGWFGLRRRKARAA